MAHRDSGLLLQEDGSRAGSPGGAASAQGTGRVSDEPVNMFASSLMGFSEEGCVILYRPPSGNIFGAEPDESRGHERLWPRLHKGEKAIVFPMFLML